MTPMTFSDSVRSVLLRTTSRVAPAEQEGLRRAMNFRRHFPTAEIALPVAVLRSDAVAAWVRQRGVPVEVGSSQELSEAIAAGLRPAQVTVHAHGFEAAELRLVAVMGVGRVVLDSEDQVHALASTEMARKQCVLLRMADAGLPVRFGSDAADDLVEAVQRHGGLDLVGLYCEAGLCDDDFVSYPAAVGQMIAQMAHIRREHDLVLTRLGLGGGRVTVAADRDLALQRLNAEIDDALDDACAASRFPRPTVTVSTGLAILAPQPDCSPVSR